MLFARAIRNRLVLAAAGSVAVPWIVGEWVKRWLQAGMPPDPSHDEMLVDFIVVGTTMTALILLFTVAVGCWVVAVMKGPRFTADAFPVDSPRDRS